MGLTCEEEEERRHRGREGGKERRREGGMWEGGRVREGGREGEREGQGRESKGGRVMKGEREKRVDQNTNCSVQLHTPQNLIPREKNGMRGYTQESITLWAPGTLTIVCHPPLPTAVCV